MAKSELSKPPLTLSTFAESANKDVLLSRFLNAIEVRSLMLYHKQEDAVLKLLAGHHVILNTPTGSGKSLVTTAEHFFALAWGQRSVYTCPIEALVNEKFLT